LVNNEFGGWDGCVSEVGYAFSLPLGNDHAVYINFDGYTADPAGI